MTSRDITAQRLINQQITGSRFGTPAELVKWMGCIQAQDYPAAKWAIGNRIKGITDAAIESDFNAGHILRTHVLRPTWHFVSPDDIGWMLKLTAPKIKAMSKTWHKKLEIDSTVLNKSKKTIAAALTGGKQLTRDQLALLLENENINTDDIRLGFLLMDAELDGLICSGAKQGKQFTYALLDERAPHRKEFDNETAIAELTKTYLFSHGPATVHDLSWWSGLSLSDSKTGIEANRQNLAHEVINGKTYWFASSFQPAAKPGAVYLLPAFDEFAIAYKDRSDFLHNEHIKQTGSGIFKPILIIDGQIAGTWKRSINKGKVAVEITALKKISTGNKQGIKKQATRYCKFLEMDLGELSFIT